MRLSVLYSNLIMEKFSLLLTIFAKKNNNPKAFAITRIYTYFFLFGCPLFPFFGVKRKKYCTSPYAPSPSLSRENY